MVQERSKDAKIAFALRMCCVRKIYLEIHKVHRILMVLLIYEETVEICVV